MNAWIARLLGGTVCTIAVLAMGMGTAHAEEKASLKVAAQVTTKVSGSEAKVVPAKAKVKASAVRVPVKVTRPIRRKPAVPPSRCGPGTAPVRSPEPGPESRSDPGLPRARAMPGAVAKATR